MILEDFIMLGTTVPEPNGDGRVKVCSAGISPELGKLIRVYPLARRNIPTRWHGYRVPLERNPKDSRPESWKIAGDRTPGAHEHINDLFEPLHGEYPRSKRAALLGGHVVGSIEEANERKLSLAVIHPESVELTFDYNEDSPDSPQEALFELPPGTEIPAGAKRFPLMPRIRFKDETRMNHLMLRDWGAYELQRKALKELGPAAGCDYFRNGLEQALHLDRNRSSLLVGNIHRHFTSWLIISVLNGIKAEPTLFDLLPGDRPYISKKVRQAVYERDGHACVRCGSRDGLTVDHIHPHIKGGVSELANYQTLCKTCNSKKGDQFSGAALCPGSVLTTHSTRTPKSLWQGTRQSACISAAARTLPGTSPTGSSARRSSCFTAATPWPPRSFASGSGTVRAEAGPYMTSSTTTRAANRCC